MINISEEEKQLIITKITIEHWTIKDIINNNLFSGSYSTLKSRLKLWGITGTRNSGKAHQDKLKQILEDWKSGLSLCKLQSKYHIDKRTMSNYLKSLGYDIVNPQLILQFNENIFDSIDTEEKAYWLGFIYADGNIRTVKDFSRLTEYDFTLCLKQSDKNHLCKFNTFMKHKKDNIKTVQREHPKCVWYVCNKHLWETLNNYGCTPNKSLTLTFPDESIFKTPDLIRHFIRGYFEGDGCLSYEKRSKGIIPRLSVLGTQDVISKIKEYSKCISSPILEKKGVNIIYNLKCNTADSITLMNYMYEDCTIYLDRKYDRYKLFKNNDNFVPYSKCPNLEIYSK